MAAVGHEVPAREVFDINHRRRVVDDRLQELLVFKEGVLRAAPIGDLRGSDLFAASNSACVSMSPFEFEVQVSEFAFGSLADANLALQRLVGHPQRGGAREL